MQMLRWVAFSFICFVVQRCEKFERDQKPNTTIRVCLLALYLAFFLLFNVYRPIDMNAGWSGMKWGGEAGGLIPKALLSMKGWTFEGEDGYCCNGMEWQERKERMKISSKSRAVAPSFPFVNRDDLIWFDFTCLIFYASYSLCTITITSLFCDSMISRVCMFIYFLQVQAVSRQVMPGWT